MLHTLVSILIYFNFVFTKAKTNNKRKKKKLLGKKSMHLYKSELKMNHSQA